MAIKTIPLRSIEEKVDNIYEAVVVMSGQAKRVLDERIVQESIKDAEEEDYGVFDEVEEKSPEDYIELEKSIIRNIYRNVDEYDNEPKLLVKYCKKCIYKFNNKQIEYFISRKFDFPSLDNFLK